MVVEIRIKTLDSDSIPIQGAGVRFIASDVQIPGKVPPPLVGGQVDNTGTFILSYEFGLFDFWFYDVEVTARGFETTVKKYVLIPYGNKLVEDSVVLQPQELPSNVVEVDLPALVSVIQPPSIRLSNLPYTPHSTIETSIVSVTGERTPLITPVNPDGTAEVVLTDCFRLEPIPSLVPLNDLYFADRALSVDHTVSCSFVTGRLRRAIRTWQITVLFVDDEQPANLYGKWLPGATFTMERNTYMDAMILLPVGSYMTFFQNNVTTMTTKQVESNGKVFTRFRIPAVSSVMSSVRISFLKDNKEYGEVLNVKFR